MSILLSVEELNDIQSLTEEYEQLSNEAMYLLSMDERARREIDFLVTSVETAKTNELSSEAIETEVKRINDTSLYLYGVPSLEEYQEVSSELLENTKIGMIAKIWKTITDLTTSIKDVYESLKAVAGMITKYNVKKLLILKEQLEKNQIVPRSDKLLAPQISSLNKKLGIYYELASNKLELEPLQELLDQPFEVIVKYKFFKDLAGYVTDELVKPNDKRKGVPEQKETLKYLNNIKSKELLPWKRKNVKAGMIDRFIGNSFGIIALEETEKEKVAATYTLFTVPKKTWMRDIEIWSTSDMISLIEYGIASEKNYKKISEEMSQGFFLANWRELTKGRIKQFISNLTVVTGSKPVWDEINQSGHFYRSILKAMLMQHRTVKTTPDLIAEIISKMTELKK